MHRLSRLCALAAVLLTFQVAARADTLFNLNATLDEGTITGTLTLNADSTAFSAIHLTFTDAGQTSVFSTFQYQAQYSSVDYVVQSEVVDGYEFTTLYLFLATPTLAGYQGSPVCFRSQGCDFGSGSNTAGIRNPIGSFVEFDEGALTPAATAPTAVTPEPSSLLLLATGLLGGAGTCVRRLRATSAAQHLS